jgi:5-methylcytosine-specific restriction enzyme subunit McrC
MTIITIQEHDIWPSNESEKEEALKLNLNDSDKKLKKFLTERKIIDFQDIVDEGIKISSKNFIGVVHFSEFILRIIPKIYQKDKEDVWKNVAQCIFFVQDYSPENIIKYEKIPFVGDEQILQDFLIWSLIYECQELLKKGLLRSYVTHEESLPYLRGKLILKNQFLNDVRKKPQFFCEYDELEYDNLENRIILFTLIQCERIATHPELKKDLFTIIQQFSSIVQKVEVSILDINQVIQGYTRQNSHYRNAHTTCKIILENTGISDFYHGALPFSIPFFVNMNKVFEDFVTRLFEKYHEDDISAQKTQKAWDIDEFESKKFMRPDIILRNEKKKQTTIIDAKYKEKLSEDNLYQIGFYIHEYRDKYFDKNRQHAFAILPEYSNKLKSNHIFEASKSKIQIHERHISIDKFLELIKENNEEQLKSEVSKILIPKSHE